MNSGTSSPTRLIANAWRQADMATRGLLAGWIILSLLLVPAIWFSLQTPFTLVDDYGDWCVLSWAKRPAMLEKWFTTTFLGTPQRYRPFFEAYNWISWRILGDHPGLHHLLRWAVLGLIVWLGWRALRIMDRRNAGPACLVFAWILLLFPNQPVARLAPQELNSVLFLCMALLGVFRVLNAPDASLAKASPSNLALLFSGFIGLSVAKESNLPVMAWILLWLLLRHSRPFGWRTALTLALLSSVLAFTAWRAAVIAQNAAYGTAPLNMALLHKNAVWLFGDALQRNTSFLITAGLLVLLLLAVVTLCRSIKWKAWFRREQCHLFLVGVLAASVLSCLTSWRPVLRYWYPTLFALSLLAAVGCANAMDLLRSGRSVLRRTAVGILAVWLLYFAAANCGNYLWQFVTQHHAGHTDRVLLTGIDTLLREGRPIAIGYRKKDPEPEMVPHARSYFMDFLPYFHGKKRAKFADFEHPARPDSPHMLSPRSREPGMRAQATFEFPARYPVLDAALSVSAFVQGRPIPYLDGDAGAHDLDYAWRLWVPEHPAEGTDQRQPEAKTD